MNFFDRYISRQIIEKELPDHIDLGRFLIIDDGTEPAELTNTNFSTNKVIHEDLLLEKYRSLQDVLIQISHRTSIAKDDAFEVIPLIQRIKDKLALNDFELMLYKNVFHLEEIFRQPHYLLERKIEKVHVSRAKRIPSKSYQYLASHTEDWIHKSIVNFKPSRILNEELELNFDVYENQLTIIFLERCLIYLNSRIKEIQDIKSFLTEYEKLLHNRHDDKGWYKKINRNLRLIGAVYEDEHYHSENIDGSTLSETENVLTQLNKRLMILRKSELFDVVNKRTAHTVLLRNTNVLVNHKHYRYVKTLWIELNKVKPERSEKEKLQFEQNVLKGARAYALALIGYCLKDLLDYKLSGNYSSFKATHVYYPNTRCYINENGIIELTIGENNLKFVVVGNDPTETEVFIKRSASETPYILFFSEKPRIKHDRAIHINPIDPDSCERVASLLMKYITKEYLENINKEYKFEPLLKDFTGIFPEEFILFDETKYSYKFTMFPTKNITIAEIEIKLANNEDFKSIKNRRDKQRIQEKAIELANQINNNIQKLKSEYLHCVSCRISLRPNLINKFEYINCEKCNTTIDSSQKNQVIVKNTDQKYQSLNLSDWDMDYLNFNTEAL